MKRQFIFKQHYYDSKPLNGETEIKLFEHSDENSDSISSMSEEKSLKWVFEDGWITKELLEDILPENCIVNVYFSVTAPFTEKNEKPGDIDLLCVSKEKPYEAIAFECKRVKASYSEDGVPKVNNIKSIYKGLVQANSYKTIGFYRTYLMILILDDGRHSTTPNVMLRRNECATLDEVYEIPFEGKLNEDIGIVFLRVTQPTGKHFNKMAGIGYCIARNAKPSQQSTDLTQKVISFLKSGN